MKRNCCNVLFVFIFSIILLQCFAFNAMAIEGGSVTFLAMVTGSAKATTNVYHIYMEKSPATNHLSGPVLILDDVYYYVNDSTETWNWKGGDTAVMVILQDSNPSDSNHNGYYAVSSNVFVGPATYLLNFPPTEDVASYPLNLRPIPVPAVIAGAGQVNLSWTKPVEDSWGSAVNIIAYNIWRSTTGIGKASFTKIASDVTGLTYTDTTVTNEGCYYALEPIFRGSVSYGVFSANSAYVPPAVPSFTITASAGTGGTISPSGSVSVNSGESKTFSVAPATCYDVDMVLVNGSAVTLTNGQYTFPSVTANQTISATFKQNPCCTYSVQAQIDAAKQEGIQSCKNNPASCGLFGQTQLDQKVAEAVSTATSSMYTQAQLTQAVKAEQLKWDANGDGKVGLEDVIRILQVLAGLRP